MDAFAEGEALAADHAWGAAAVRFAQAAAQRMRASDAAGARAAWEAAGEAWRRDDRPKSAVQALELSRQLAPDAGTAAMAAIKLAGTLSELGELAPALQLLEQVREAGPDNGPVAAMVLDEQINALLGLGRRDDARKLLPRLANAARGPLAVATAFREAQIARMDGRFSEAERALTVVIGQLTGQPQALSGVAAAQAELAEIAAMRGEHAAALSLYDDALAQFQKVGRKALVWRADAGRVRVAVEANLAPWVRGLDAGIAFAEDRGMASLETDLRIARGVGSAAADRAAAGADLERAIRLSTEMGSPHRRGRARLELFKRVSGDATLLAAAIDDLEGNEPWRLRARLALAMHEGHRDALVSCLARASAIGMAPEIALAKGALAGR
jgi:tetratricopeptide (TPR) repeat protein